MGIVYPTGIDSFTPPTNPESTSLSADGGDGRNHYQAHLDLGRAIVALETNSAPLSHDHSTTDGNGTWPTNQLDQVNTHQNPDTDSSIASLHHTLGRNATQAAPGNHAHDYNSGDIFNKPFLLCTTQTRPIDPQVGQMIWETDTQTMRVWGQFPTITPSAGTNYTYAFSTANSATGLDGAVFSQTVVTGSVPTNGAMGAAVSGVCAWNRGTNVTCRVIERGLSNSFVTDDQQISAVTGTTQLQAHYSGSPSPSNDFYLRVSTNLQSYVRFSLQDTGVYVYYTNTGPSGEMFLGGAACATNATKTTWLFKTIGNTYLVYANGQQVLAAVDNANSVSIGSTCRGWGIGMQAGAGQTAQTVPNSLSQVSVIDLPYYASNTKMTWQLLPIGNKPHIIAQANFGQQVYPLNPRIVGFDTLFGNWLPDPFMNVQSSQTDIVIKETGVYQVNASICWDPGYGSFDTAGIGFSVNGQDIARLAKNFMRGNGYAPGFSQTQACSFTYSFNYGDVLHVTAQHNSQYVCWLFHSTTPGNSQACWVELSFLGPPIA